MTTLTPRPAKRRASGTTEYRGHKIRHSRGWKDYRVTFPCGRTRYGTLEQVQADVDAYLAGTLPAKGARA